MLTYYYYNINNNKKMCGIHNSHRSVVERIIIILHWILNLIRNIIKYT